MTVAADTGPEDDVDPAHPDRDHGWARIREDRVQFSELRVRRAAEFIDSCGIADELQNLIAKTTGRPRLCTVKGLLVGMALCSRRNPSGAVLFNQVTDILHWAIPAQWRREFGLPDRPDNSSGFEAGYGVVLRLFRAIIAALDPSPLPKNRRLTAEQAKAYFEAADPELLSRRREALIRISNCLVQASIASIDQHLAEFWDGSVGVDATPVATFARGVSAKKGYTSTDPDAAFYVRQGDHRDPDLAPAPPGRRRRTKDKVLWGYDATLAVARNPHRDPAAMPNGCGDTAAIPALTLGFVLDKPGHGPGLNGVAVLQDIRRRGHPAGDLAADAAYNNSDPENWQIPLRQLGYQPTYDYRVDQLGKIDSVHGAIQVEGTWYCPSMPIDLINATRDLRTREPSDLKAIDQETWRARIEARTNYALAPKGRPDANGRQRYMCPATAGSRCQCPLKPSSLGTNPRLPLVDPMPSPVGPPKICEQTSISTTVKDGAKHWQPRPYGSPEWQKIYGRLRNAVEGMNGYAKTDAYEGIERAGNRRIRGIAAQTFLLAFQLAHANERKINAWLATLPGPDGQPHRRARYKKSKPLGTWTPTGHVDPSVA